MRVVVLSRDRDNLFRSGLLAGLMLVAAAGCKREAGKVQGGSPSVTRAPRMAAPTAPSTQQIAKESRAKLLEGYYDLPGLGKGTAYTAPDGELWNQYNNGMLIHELRLGSEGMPAKLGQKLDVAITGTVVSSGKVFIKKNADDPFTFALGTKKLPQGLSLAVLGMKIGGKRRIFVPQELAYGANGDVSQGIDPSQALIFEIELLDIKGDPLPVDIEDLPHFEPLGPPAPGALGASPHRDGEIILPSNFDSRTRQ